jgi:hypothetical protein
MRVLATLESTQKAHTHRRCAFHCIAQLRKDRLRPNGDWETLACLILQVPTRVRL